MAVSSGWQLAAEIGGGLLGTMLGGNLMGSSAAAQQDRQFSHNWGLMEHQARLNQQAVDYQNALNVSNYQNRYKWSVDDMRRAGLNPVLAATQGIAGSVQGASALGAGLGSVGMSQIPDYMSGVNSAVNNALSRRVQEQQMRLTSRELDLKERDINSAISMRQNDMIIAQGRLDLEKWIAHESMRLKEVMQDAQIKNMVERLQADIEHMQRMDANGAIAASAAMAHANAAGLMAAVQEKLGMKREEMMQAQEAYIGLQSENAVESLKWQRWLNDHPYTRGAVGLIGSILDTAGLASAVAKPGSALFNNALSGSDDVVAHVPDYESWIR